MIRCLIWNPFAWAFLLLPPVFIALRLWGRSRIPLWASFIGFVPIGWILMMLGIECRQWILQWMIHHIPNAPVEWEQAWIADGGPRAFALLFGWAEAIIYFTVCLIPMWAVAKYLKWVKKKRASTRLS